MVGVGIEMCKGLHSCKRPNDKCYFVMTKLMNLSPTAHLAQNIWRAVGRVQIVAGVGGRTTLLFETCK